MRRSFPRRQRDSGKPTWWSVAVVAGAMFMAWASTTAQEPAARQFRAGVAAVPVEVLVVDANGDPVVGLTASDFTIREGGVPQEVALFRAVSVAGPLATEGRTFLIVLGRGRLNQPTKALDALINFVRSSLQPRDRVGLTAYLRVIEPTTNHDAVARFLTAYRARHENIDGLLRRDSRDYRYIARSGINALDALFEPYAALVRYLPGAEGNVLSLHHTSLYLRYSLSYLRSAAGNKHAIVVSEHPFGGMGGPAPDDPRKNIWFRLAAGARTALTYIHAGGLHGTLAGQSMDRGRLITQSADRFGKVKDFALFTDQTGGISAFFKFAAEPLALLDRMTRHHYLLGYYPQTQVADHEFRVIQVSVKRPGLRVLYRHGYVSQPPEVTDADFRLAMTEDRLETVVARLVDPPPSPFGFVGGIIVTAIRIAGSWQLSGTGGRLDVSVSFDPERVTFTRDGDDYLTDLDLLLLADDERHATIGQRRLKLNIRLTSAEFARIRREWLRYDTTLDLPAKPAFLRAVLFDYETDRAAAAQVRLTK